MNDKPFNIGIAGLGTVGTGVVQIIERNHPVIKEKIGRNIEIKAISARNRSKSRNINLNGYEWVDDVISLSSRDDLDCIVEVIGGTGNPSKALVEQSIRAGKHLVTANKALLAEHGHSLAKAAEKSKVALRFEAAVAGGIPIVKALMEGLASNNIKKEIFLKKEN